MSQLLVSPNTTETFENNDKLYIKAFLLDTSLNLNDWAVSADSIEKNIASFVGRPLVLTDDFSHPVPSEEATLNQWLAMQEPYRVGEIREITKKDNAYYAIIEITNADVRQALIENKIPLYVSPAIASKSDEPDSNMANWIGVHLAIVSDPAFTVKKAQITAQCGGDEDQCFSQLRTANTHRKKCPKMLLASLISSQGILHEKNTITMVENTVSNSPISLENATVPKSDFDALQSKYDALVAENNERKEVLTSIQERMANIEKERRTEKIAAIVTKDVISDDNKRNEKIASLVASNMSIDSIQDLFSVFTVTKHKTAAVIEPRVQLSSGSQQDRKVSDAEIAMTIAGYLPIRGGRF